MMRFIIYGLLGWNIEVIWTGVCGLVAGDINLVGQTSLWMFLIYGGGGLLFERVVGVIKQLNLFERGMIWMLLIFAVEFISGGLLRLIGITPWYYDGLFSVAGLIRLDYAPLWFLVGLIFEKVHTYINDVFLLK